MGNVFAAISSIFKYLFILIIYLFIFGIMRMIFLDIRKNNVPRPKNIPRGTAYLQLLTDKNGLYFEARDVYPLEGEKITVGRSERCDITIDDLYMSARHARFWLEDDEWHLADLGSTNGTYINGTRMDGEPLLLDSGDRVKIGQLEFLVVI